MVAPGEGAWVQHQRPALDGHRTAERRSLAMHARIAQRLNAATLGRARERVESWLQDGTVDERWGRAWRDLLADPVPVVAAAISRDDETMRALRQTTPFAGALTNAERWHILRTVR